MKTTLRAAATLACIMLISAAAVSEAKAHGSHITYGPTAFGSFAAGTAGSFNIPQFDPSLGTLTEVDLLVTGHSDGGSNGLQNLSAFPGNASVTIGTNITVSGPAALTVLTLPNTTNSGPVAPFGGSVDFTFSGPDSILVLGAPSSDSQSDSIFAGFAPYLGLGLVTFNYSSGANTSSSADVAPTFSSTTPPTFDFDATVVYHYEAVPEPTTLVLAGLGALGLVFAARRKRVA